MEHLKKARLAGGGGRRGRTREEMKYGKKVVGEIFMHSIFLLYFVGG